MMLNNELIPVFFINGKWVTHCPVCNKKLKGKTEHGFIVSVGMHYKKRHGLVVTVSKQTILSVIFNANSRTSSTV